MGVYAHVCVCLGRSWRSQVDIKCLPQSLLTVHFEAVSLTESGSFDSTSRAQSGYKWVISEPPYLAGFYAEIQTQVVILGKQTCYLQRHLLKPKIIFF